METCERCGSGVVYRFNARPTPESTYVYICLGRDHHVHADPATIRLDARAGSAPVEHRSRILDPRPLRTGGFSVATA